MSPRSSSRNGEGWVAGGDLHADDVGAAFGEVGVDL